MILEIVRKSRSYRRFDTSVKISRAELLSMVEAARLSPCAGNHQALRFAIINDEKTANAVFNTLAFAAYLKDWNGPAESERPVAYIVVMLDSDLTANRAIDAGIAAQSMLLRASELGYGGCMFRSFDRERLDKLLDRAPYRAELVIALGKPSENVEIVDFCGDIKYYRDENDTHCVPKLSLDELIID